MTYCLHFGCFNRYPPLVSASDLKWEDLNHPDEFLTALNSPYAEVPTLFDYIRIGAKQSTPKRIQDSMDEVPAQGRIDELTLAGLKPAG